MGTTKAVIDTNVIISAFKGVKIITPAEFLVNYP